MIWPGKKWEQRIARLEQEARSVEHERHALEQSVTKLDERLKRIEEQQPGLSEELEELNGLFEELQPELNKQKELKGTLDVLRAELHRLQMQTDADIEQIRRGLTGLLDQIRGLQAGGSQRVNS